MTLSRFATGFGYLWMAVFAVLTAFYTARWALHRLVDGVWWVRARVAVRRRPSWIPAAPRPLTPWAPRPKARLTNEDIITRLRDLDSELEAEYGDSYVQVLDRIYGNHRTDY